MFLTLKAETLSEARKNAGDPESGRKGRRGEDSCGLVLSRRCGNSKPLVSHLLVSTGQHREPSSSLFAQSQLAQVPRPDCHLLVSLLRLHANKYVSASSGNVHEKEHKGRIFVFFTIVSPFLENGTSNIVSTQYKSMHF